MDLAFIRHRIDTLSMRCENLTADQIKESLDRISNDLKEVSFKLAAESRGVWNYTGLKEAEYHDWYWNVYVKDILSDADIENIFKE